MWIIFTAGCPGEEHLLLGLGNFKILAVGFVHGNFKEFPGETGGNGMRRVYDPVPLVLVCLSPAQALGSGAHQLCK